MCKCLMQANKQRKLRDKAQQHKHTNLEWFGATTAPTSTTQEPLGISTIFNEYSRFVFTTGLTNQIQLFVFRDHKQPKCLFYRITNNLLVFQDHQMKPLQSVFNGITNNPPFFLVPH